MLPAQTNRATLYKNPSSSGLLWALTEGPLGWHRKVLYRLHPTLSAIQSKQDLAPVPACPLFHFSCDASAFAPCLNHSEAPTVPVKPMVRTSLLRGTVSPHHCDCEEASCPPFSPCPAFSPFSYNPALPWVKPMIQLQCLYSQLYLFLLLISKSFAGYIWFLITRVEEISLSDHTWLWEYESGCCFKPSSVYIL